MAVGSAGKCAKMMLIIFNIVFWVTGVAMLAVGIYLVVQGKSIQQIGGDIASDVENYKTASEKEDIISLKTGIYIMIAVGAFIFLAGFLGCCGAIKENTICLSIYILLLLVAIVVEIAAIVFILYFQELIIMEGNKAIKRELKKDNFATEKTGTEYELTPFGLTMSVIQQNLECCGIEGPDDYKTSNYTKVAVQGFPNSYKYKEFPWTCCIFKNDTKILEGVYKMEDVANEAKCLAKDPQSFYNMGCGRYLEEAEQSLLMIAVGILFAVCFIDIFGLIFAVCLCRNTSKE